MAYRRSTRKGEAVQEWADWRRRHTDLILASGLPEHVFNPENWDDFTEYGFLWEGGIAINEMTVTQKVALLRIILERPIDLGSHAGHLLVRAILDALDEALKQGYSRDAHPQ